MSPFPRPEYALLTPYRPDRRPVDVDLSDNTSLRGPHPAALQVVRDAQDTLLTRYPSVYADDLRRALTSRFRVPLDSVTTGCGSDDLLDSLFRAVAAPGEAVAYLDPTFSMVPIFGHMNGVRPLAVPGIPLPEPKVLLDPDPALVYLCTPNNPTGEVLPREWVERLLAQAAHRKGGGPVVVLDEAYADFAEGSWIQEAPRRPRFLVIRTLSKAYGMAGMRVGFAVGDPEVVAELEKSRGPYKVSALAEAAALAALEDREGWVESHVREVREARSRILEELRRRGLAPLSSEANFVLLPVPDAGSITAGLRDRGVAVRPFPEVPGLGDAIRVSVGRWDLMERFLAALDAELPGGGPESVRGGGS
jgi:histidinol-phosphate aminotransferase